MGQMPVTLQIRTHKSFQKWQLTRPQVDVQPPLDSSTGLLILNKVRAIRPWGLRRSHYSASAKTNSVLAVPQRYALWTVGLDK